MNARFPARAVWAGILVVLAAASAAPDAWAAPEDARPVAAPAAGAAPCPLCTPKECTCYTCECRKPGRPTCPATYHNLRFEEDWSACTCVPRCDRGDWSDWLKAQPLDSCRTFRLDVGGQVRVRYEGWLNQGLGAAGTPSDDSWGLLRLRAHADMHVSTWGRVFAEGIYADIWRRELGPRPIDRNRVDFLNLFAEVHATIAGAKALASFGRREIQEGVQRLVSPLDWANTRRTFDGLFGRYQRGHHRLDAWAMRPVIVDPSGLDEWFNEDVDTAFWGLYYTNRTWTCRTWEVYVLGLHREDAAYLGVTGDEDRYTIGGRIGGQLPHTAFDYDVEVAAQIGTFADDDIYAGMLALVFGWKPCWTCWNERLEVGFDYASGDGSGSGLGTFNQLYPLGHKYLGFADVLARQNVVSGHLMVTAKPLEKLTLAANLLGFWRASDEDGVYNIAGGVLRPAVPGVDDLYVGSELDLWVVYPLDRHWKFTGGWSRFFAGDYLENTGPHKDVTFFWLDAQFTF